MLERGSEKTYSICDDQLINFINSCKAEQYKSIIFYDDINESKCNEYNKNHLKSEACLLKLCNNISISNVFDRILLFPNITNL